MPSNNLNPDRVLIFDIKGPMAHFRKYYTNSSSLSYLFPPRTVVIGLIAGLLGLPSERHTKEIEDVYYEKFDIKNCLVAVSLRSKIRQIMQTVNYIRTKSLSEVDGSSGGTQIPLEILLPENDYDVTYRVYFYHLDEDIYIELKGRLEKEKFVFPPYLGITEFLASIDYINEGELSKNLDFRVELGSVCKLNEVELDFSGKDLQYITQKMPTGFLNDRTPRKPEEYVLEVKGKIMKVKLKDNAACYSVSYSEDCCGVVENIMFM
ncbi:MAG: type I-B CRISPR-associated protein Cas5b [Halobacteriota archaeon]|nr:type I-B CRISPR-associated protein Cas5b [Halobacteriota archaeon]